MRVHFALIIIAQILTHMTEKQHSLNFLSNYIQEKTKSINTKQFWLHSIIWTTGENIYDAGINNVNNMFLHNISSVHYVQ